MAETVAQAIARRQREREALEAEEERARRGAPTFIQQRGGGLTGALREGVLQADTAARSAANTFTFGGADSLAAGLDALVPSDKGIGERYEANLAAEQARNDYDALHRPLARQVGMGAATALALFGEPGPAAAKLFAAVRPTAAKRLTTVALSGRDTAAILGGGAASGLALQNLSDVAAHKPGDWRDNLGAMAGGLAGAAALGFTPGRAAAIGSATTTAVQDLLHRRGVSLEDLSRSAVAGRAVGALAAKTGAQLSQSLTKQAKGRLGEALGTVRSAINRMEREPGPKQLVKPDPARRGTVPDGHHGDILFEDKFGLKAALRKGQRIAQSILGPNYIVYHWLPEDIGRILSSSLAGLGSQLANAPPSAGYHPPPRSRR